VVKDSKEMKQHKEIKAVLECVTGLEVREIERKPIMTKINPGFSRAGG